MIPLNVSGPLSVSLMREYGVVICSCDDGVKAGLIAALDYCEEFKGKWNRERKRNGGPTEEENITTPSD